MARLTISLPGTNGAQMYGLGLPTTYIQGIGQSKQPFDNIPIGLFFQDSWRAGTNLTLNFGLRWDLMQYWSEKYNQIPALNLGQHPFKISKHIVIPET